MHLFLYGILNKKAGHKYRTNRFKCQKTAQGADIIVCFSVINSKYFIPMNYSRKTFSNPYGHIQDRVNRWQIGLYYK